MNAWKRQVASPGVAADQQGDAEAAIYLNDAKDTLLKWLEKNPPHDDHPTDPDDPSRVPRTRLPHSGAGAIALPLPVESD